MKSKDQAPRFFRFWNANALSFHWYLAIICNLPAVNRTMHTEKSAQSPQAAKTPEIIQSLQEQTAQLQLKDRASDIADGSTEDASSEWPDPDENPRPSTDSPFRQSASAPARDESITKSAGALLPSLPGNNTPKKGKRKRPVGSLKKYDPAE